MDVTTARCIDRLACQEVLLPGATIGEKSALASDLGFAAIELIGHGDHALRARLPELRAARRSGAVFSSVCVVMDHFIGDVDADLRRDAIENLKSQLSVIAELGGTGVITPAAFGKHSNVLPPFTPSRSPDDDTAVLLDALHELGEHAGSVGVSVLFEPLNRYEDHMCNTVQQAADLCRKVGLPSLRVMADVFHMSIEEVDTPAALSSVAPVLGHVHLADSNRLEPGCGHTDFAAILAALDRIGFGGYLAFECGLSGDDAAHALGRSVQHLRRCVG
jgi:sugar phosphate isomerase/epimerase